MGFERSSQLLSRPQLDCFVLHSTVASRMGGKVCEERDKGTLDKVALPQTPRMLLVNP
jgi:hypothetical protein